MLLFVMSAVTHPEHRAFSLIEVAIVLAIVGLVIGGIWVAATRVRQASTVVDAATIVTHLVTGAQRLFTPDTYPTSYGAETSITSTSFNAGLAPGATLSSDNTTILAPSNLKLRIVQACWDTSSPSQNCPQLGIKVMPGLSAQACNELLRKVASNKSLLYAQVQTASNTAYQLFYNGMTPNCPADYSTLIMWFKAYP